MRKYRRVGNLCLWAVVGVWCASAQPKVSTPKLTFSYQVNASALPVSQTVQVTVPTSLAGSLMFTIPRVRAQKHPQPENGESADCQWRGKEKGGL